MNQSRNKWQQNSFSGRLQAISDFQTKNSFKTFLFGVETKINAEQIFFKLNQKKNRDFILILCCSFILFVYYEESKQS